MKSFKQFCTEQDDLNHDGLLNWQSPQSKIANKQKKTVIQRKYNRFLSRNRNVHQSHYKQFHQPQSY